MENKSTEIFGKTFSFDRYDVTKIPEITDVLKRLSEIIAEPLVIYLASAPVEISLEKDYYDIGRACFSWLVNRWHKSESGSRWDSLDEITDEDTEFAIEANKGYMYTVRRKYLFHEDAQTAVKEEVVRGISALEQIVLDFKNDKIEAKKLEETLYKERMELIQKVETKENTTYDEGGKTTQYTHTVTMKDGEQLTFVDRNVFDVGRIITPTYLVEGVESPLMLNIDNVLVWRDFKKGILRNLTENERIATRAIRHHFGHCQSGIRM